MNTAVTPTFDLPKATGTYADILAACGLAELLGRARRTTPPDPFHWTPTSTAPDAVRIEDVGDGFRIHAAGFDLESANLGRFADDPAFTYVILKSEKGEGAESGAFDRIDYEEERKRLLAYRQARSRLFAAAKGKRPDQKALAELDASKPRPDDWYLIQSMNVLQALKAYNKLHADIRSADATAVGETLRGRLRALSAGDPPPEKEPLQPKVSVVQMFNPTCGKGVNRLKPDGASPGGLPAAYADWFQEWLKFIGIRKAAIAQQIGDDIKVLAIHPQDLDMHTLEALRYELLTGRAFPRAGTSPRRDRAEDGSARANSLPFRSVSLDVHASLYLAERLLRHSNAYAGEETGLVDMYGRTPRRLVAGLATAYFQSLGSARALTNLSFVGLPGWFPIAPASERDRAREDAILWLRILDEHRTILRRLNEERSEELHLLQRYRDFLSMGTEHGLPILFEFLADYGAHVIRAREGRDGMRAARQFTTDNLEALVTRVEAEREGDRRYSTILQTPGFRRIAAAIRRSTVNAQYQKVQREASGEQSALRYEIRYGLSQEWKRKARLKSEFIVKLSDFVNAFNAETARKAEQVARKRRGGELSEEEARSLRRPAVTTQDVEEVVALIDDCGSEPVCMLLLAYGYARLSAEPGATGEADEEADTTDELATEPDQVAAGE